MLLISLIILLVSSAITIRRDKSILYSRIAVLVLLITDLLIINTLTIFPQGSTIATLYFVNVSYMSLISQIIAVNISIFTIFAIKKSNSKSVLTIMSKLLFKSMWRQGLISIFYSIIYHIYPFIGVFIMIIESINLSFSMLPYEESLKLNDDMWGSLKHMQKMVHEMKDIKNLNNIKIILDDGGNLSIEVPDSLSQKDAYTISQKVGIMDRVYESQLTKYKELTEKDISSNEGRFSKGFNQSYNTILENHKKLFDK